MSTQRTSFVLGAGAGFAGDRVDEVDWQASVAGGEWIGAHAYLGIDPMVEALEGGADVVITGRVADSSLFARKSV